MMQGFIYGGNTGKTPEDLKRERAIAEALANFNQPKNVGEGVGAVLRGLAGGIITGRADRAEKAGRAAADTAFSPVLKALAGKSFPDKPSGALPTPEVQTEISASTPSGDPVTGDIYKGFMDTVQAGGVSNPNALAAIAATGRAESGWSPKTANRRWSDPSESGQAGTSGGIMSWRNERLANLESFAKQNGEDPRNISPTTQAQFFLQENPQLIEQLNKAGSVEEAQSLMNGAWKFAGYDRPGGEAANRLGYAKGYLQNFQGGQEVASADPATSLAGSYNPSDDPAAVQALAAQTPGYVDPTVSSVAGRAGQGDATAQALAQPQITAQASMGGTGQVPQLPVSEQAQLPVQTQQAQQPVQGDQVAQALASPQRGMMSVIDPSQAPQGVADASEGMPQEAILQALTNPWATDEQRGVAEFLLKKNMAREQALQERKLKQSDPEYQLGIEKLRAEVQNLTNPREKEPDSVRALRLRAQEAGLEPGTKPWQDFMLSGGNKGQTINVDTGTIPAGMQAVRDAEGRVLRYEPVPGSPASAEAEALARKQASQSDSKDTFSDVITTAADRARQASNEAIIPTDGTIGKIVGSVLPGSNAAEVRRQVAVLKSNATIENLNSMRQQSPTGGALGSVTQEENAMLAAKVGALDPDSPNFQRDLDDYEQTLLRVIHGKDAGDVIFSASRKKPDAVPTEAETEAVPEGIDPEDWKFMDEGQKSLWRQQ